MNFIPHDISAHDMSAHDMERFERMGYDVLQQFYLTKMNRVGTVKYMERCSRLSRKVLIGLKILEIRR